jgi:hypothetical protein
MSDRIDDINAVRAALFDALRGLSNKENPMDIERAKAVCDVSQAIINTAKVEIDFTRATGLVLASDFIPVEEKKPLGLGGPSAIKTMREKGILEDLPSNITSPRPGVLVHKMK